MQVASGLLEFTLWIEEDGKLVQASEYLQRDTVYVEGKRGQRYVLRARNTGALRIEVIPTVDGLDVHSGKDASFDQRGLILPAHATFDFEGFRLSSSDVATFRFGGVEQSYASQIGKPRNVGVIGIAVFEEKQAPPPKPVIPIPQQSDQGFLPPNAPRAASQSSFGPIPPSAPPSQGAPPPSPGAPRTGSGPAAGPPPASRAAPSPAPSPAPSGLGTSFGEKRTSVVSSTQFERRTATPVGVAALRYEDRDGLRALGIDVNGLARRETANPFPGESQFAKPPPGWKG